MNRYWLQAGNMENEILEVDVDDLPPGYVLIRKEDGVFAFLKMEPGDMEDDEDGDEEQHEIVEEIVQEGDADMEVTEALDEDEEYQEEIDINVIPDIIEEDLPPDLSPDSFEQTITSDQVEFVDGTVVSSSDRSNLLYSRKSKYISTPNLWRGVSIPPHLTQEEVQHFKTKHLLQRLSEIVKRNRQKVEVYEKKNLSLRDLIANQKEQMMKMGFHVKDIIRHNNIRVRKDPGPRIPSPLMPLDVMNEAERMEYEKTRLDVEYEHLRKRLKTLLSGYRRYKKLFVDNHEKLKKGPRKRENVTVYQKREAARLQQTQDSDSDSELAKGIYKCYHCRYGAKTKAELRSHIEGHLSQKQYECCVCPYFTSRITPFLEHMKSHPGAKAFRCKHCAFRTAYPSAMRNHEATHLEVKPYKCPVCGFRTIRSDHLRNHMRKHKSDRAFKCELCPFTSKYSSGLSKHKKTLHAPGYVSKRKPFHMRNKPTKEDSECEGGGETTEIEIDETGKMLVVRHSVNSSSQQNTDERGVRRRSTRANVKKVMPDYVEGDEFDEGDEIVVEEETEQRITNIKIEEIVEDDEEGEIVYEESEPNDSAHAVEESSENESEDGVKAEMVNEEDDSGEEDLVQQPHKGRDLLSSYVIYQCVFCEFSCEMKHSLLTHLRSHMDYWTFTCRACNFVASNPTDLKSHTEDHKNEGECHCPYCDRLTSSRIQLKRHIERRHPAGKPLACIYCDYISSSRSSMKTHMQGHKTKKVWQCLICDYKADFRSGLKRHLRKHTGERPYNCPHCEFNAAQYSHLTRHLRKNHPHEPHLDVRPASPFVIL
ncbi:hypothetical protein GE061_005787 [Apolygus lucorum]|uniref:C2H2-type domain-containing protein n=1 Tax=Apolygus lucorum TaxID=248454 RepID=A0A6A4J525_APOLU|nr:hypothetical protein GE061_005787 [Apolygus lucorum]